MGGYQVLSECGEGLSSERQVEVTVDVWQVPGAAGCMLW